MTIIRPNALPSATTPLGSTDAILVDQGAGGVNKATPTNVVDAVAPVASQSEAEAGIDNQKRMTTLRVKQSIASEVFVSLGTVASGGTGSSNAAGARANLNVYSKEELPIGDGNPATPLTHSGEQKLASFSNSDWSAGSLYNAVYPSISFYDALQSRMELASGSTIIHASAIAGYAKNKVAASGIARNAVSLFGLGTSEVNGAATWGINTLLQDDAARLGAPGSGTGRILVNEFDFNVMHASTQIIGLSIGGNSVAQPTTANGFIVNPLGTGIKWTTGLLLIDGAATNGVAIGAKSSSGNNIDSQNIVLSWFNSGGTKKSANIYMTGATEYLLISPVSTWAGVAIQGGDLLIDANKAIKMNGLNALFNDASGNVALGNSSKITTLSGVRVTVDSILRFTYSSSGAGSALLGANCPAVTVSAPYSWIQMQTNDGSTVYVPCWK